MRTAAAAAGVPVVTGDTKVVDRGKGDGVYVNTAGIGLVEPESSTAEHGAAILSVREGLEFESAIESDSAPLHGLVATLVARLGTGLHVLRVPTRGGVASALNEIAQRAGVGVRLEESSIPVIEPVRAVCELLGLDPLYVANEGKLLAIVAREAADSALDALRSHPLGRDAAIVGEVIEPDGPRACWFDDIYQFGRDVLSGMSRATRPGSRPDRVPPRKGVARRLRRTMAATTPSSSTTRLRGA